MQKRDLAKNSKTSIRLHKRINLKTLFFINEELENC